MGTFNGIYTDKGINQATGKRYEIVLSLTQAGDTLTGTYVVRGQMGRSLKDLVLAQVHGSVQDGHAVAEIKNHRLELTFKDESRQQIWLHSENGNLFDSVLKRVSELP
ncbi:MAG: hypothetical protein U0Y10_13850 [Spirosomataceae bacterium]